MSKMSKYKCFLDFEFTTTGDDEFDEINNNKEILSIAGVIIDEKNNTVDEFYEVVKPTKNIILHPFCIDLTKLTQKEIDNANTFNIVACNFMNFFNKYKTEGVNIYTWGHFDSLVIKKTFEITGYSGDFNYVYENMINIQKRICCSITYNRQVIKSVWSLKDVKRVYKLKESSNSHNALVDARDLRDVYLAYKNKSPKNFNFITQVYKKHLHKSLVSSEQKEFFFDAIPGELKYGLEKLFKYCSYQKINTESIIFNKKTMQFLMYDNKKELFDTGLIRYNKMSLSINILNDNNNDTNINNSHILLRFKIKNKNIDCNIEPTFKVNMSMKNIQMVNSFIKKVKECDNQKNNK